jgi:hypothetical protein
MVILQPQARFQAPRLGRSPAAAGVIAAWRRAVLHPDPDQAREMLRSAYIGNRPRQAEIVFTGECVFRCAHCIYTHDYDRHNRELAVDEWLRILVAVERELGITTFTHCGRSVTAAGVELLVGLRRRFPQARIGIVDNGISLVPHLSALAQARLDWIDISLDGLARDHDRQRAQHGSFDAALRGIELVRRHDLALRTSILTCASRLNHSGIAEMIRSLNGTGIQNFVVTPVAFEPGARPAVGLRLNRDQLRRLVEELDDVSADLDDAYIEIGFFEADDWQAIANDGPIPAAAFREAGDHLAAETSIGTTTRVARYFPGSINGVREFTLNTDGRLIVPKAMAWGRIPITKVAGDLTTTSPAAVWRQLPESPALQFYFDELEKERTHLQPVVREAECTRIPALVAGASPS